MDFGTILVSATMVFLLYVLIKVELIQAPDYFNKYTFLPALQLYRF